MKVTWQQNSNDLNNADNLAAIDNLYLLSYRLSWWIPASQPINGVNPRSLEIVILCLTASGYSRATQRLHEWVEYPSKLLARWILRQEESIARPSRLWYQSNYLGRRSRLGFLDITWNWKSKQTKWRRRRIFDSLRFKCRLPKFLHYRTGLQKRYPI